VKKTALLLVALAALVVSASARAAGPLSGWWPLYEGSGTIAHDSSGNHDNGTLSGNANWTSGYFGSALSFDGSTGRVDVPDSAALEPSSAVSVTAYVKASGTPGAYKYIVSKGADACIASSYALYTGANGGLEFYISQNGGLTYALSPDAGAGVWDGNWHFVVGTYDGTAVHLYVDGKQVGSGTQVSGPISYGLSSGNDLFLGHYDGCSGLDFAGSIDEPTVWSRALSPTQVSMAYQLFTALHGWVSRLPSFPGS
jgi:hypothetical protein